jgi:Sec-independent protein translocase protein TatA
MYTIFYKEASMAQQGGLKRVLLVVVFLLVAAIAFILLGGDKLIESAGTWIHGMGKKAGEVKQTVEKTATTVEKGVTKGIDTIKQGEKK